MGWLSKRTTKASCHPEKPHVAKGLCNACYRHMRYHAKWKSSNTERSRLWRNKNRDKWRLWKKEAERRKRERKATRPRASSCEICARVCFTFFDHDHSTGQFRGWICEHCNKALGFVKDDPALLRKLAEYLEKADN